MTIHEIAMALETHSPATYREAEAAVRELMSYGLSNVDAGTFAGDCFNRGLRPTHTFDLLTNRRRYSLELEELTRRLHHPEQFVGEDFPDYSIKEDDPE